MNPVCVCVEVRLSIVVGDRSLCVESDREFHLQGMRLALWCIVLTPRLISMSFANCHTLHFAQV